MKSRRLGLLLVMCLTLAKGLESHAKWPSVKEFETTIHLDETKTKAEFWFQNSIGKRLYCLTCYLNGFDVEDAGFDYSGDFECRLISLYDQSALPSLLMDRLKTTADWQSRGRFLNEEIDPENLLSKDPAYGRDRIFHLRGMALEIKVISVRYSKAKKNPRGQPLVEELTANIGLRHSPKSLSAQAERPPTPCPKPCSH